eukprot:scaffold45406_cov17-Tisochrysis_lutea.AAC.5
MIPLSPLALQSWSQKRGKLFVDDNLQREGPSSPRVVYLLRASAGDKKVVGRRKGEDKVTPLYLPTRAAERKH